MKTGADLRIPFAWEDRHPILLEKCLYIPPCCDRREKWAPLTWSEEKLFGNNHPIYLEFCSGNGQWITNQAKKNPNLNWVAVEKRFDRARKIWAHIWRESLSNLFVICGEGLTVARSYIAPQSTSAIFINFPDPWCKRRHAKHRLITPLFIQELSRIAVNGATATLVTDDAPYTTQILKAFAQCSAWHPLFPPPHFTLDWPNYGASFFADLWKEKGRHIYYIPYQLSHLLPPVYLSG